MVLNNKIIISRVIVYGKKCMWVNFEGTMKTF